MASCTVHTVRAFHRDHPSRFGTDSWSSTWGHTRTPACVLTCHVHRPDVAFSRPHPPPTGEAEKVGGSADAGFALQTSQPHVWTCLLFCWAPRFSGIAQREATDHAVASRPPWHVVPDRAARPRLPVQAVQMHRCACVRSRPLPAAGLPPAMCLTLLLF